MSLEWVRVMLGVKQKRQMGWRGIESLQPRPEFINRTAFYSFIKAERASNNFFPEAGVST